ncbi:RidA family protein [Maribellus comscasis]|uniref:RidA family protein n=1 Tax=Maribellus comscasis TaxID=2681766 RepID=A0A6I6K0H3_9BACT|nr:RidA family protein [Maribellus comscasis]QGY44903.1 RidA family protein [Maribellus comscasis]
MNTIEEKIKTLGLELPPAPPLGGIYHPVVIAGNQLYISGQGPLQSDGTLIKGKVGKDLTLEEGQLAARQVGLTMLATIKAQIGDLGKIKRLIKTLGMVNCYPEFEQHPQTINGFSQLMVDVFGEENGKGARSAVGMSLPGNIAVEVECIFELKED